MMNHERLRAHAAIILMASLWQSDLTVASSDSDNDNNNKCISTIFSTVYTFYCATVVSDMTMQQKQLRDMWYTIQIWQSDVLDEFAFKFLCYKQERTALSNELQALHLKSQHTCIKYIASTNLCDYEKQEEFVSVVSLSECSLFVPIGIRNVSKEWMKWQHRNTQQNKKSMRSQQNDNSVSINCKSYNHNTLKSNTVK